MTDNCKPLSGYYDKLEKMNPDAEEQKQIADARKDTLTYIDTVTKWREELKRDENSSQLADLDKQNTEAGGIAVAKAVSDYLAAKSQSQQACRIGLYRGRHRQRSQHHAAQ